MNITLCFDCGKDFKYPSKLERHLGSKNCCPKNPQKGNINPQKGNINPQKGNINPQKGNMEDTESYFCTDCEKEISRYDNFIRHKSSCRKVPDNVCKYCKKVFVSKNAIKVRARHEREIYCTEHRDMNRLQQENEEMRLRIEELENERRQPQTIINNTINNNYNITFIQGVLTCDDPNMIQNKLLCLEEFCRRFFIDNTGIDKNELKKKVLDVINNNDYDGFYKFLFRNDDKKDLQLAKLSKNIGATHFEVFKKGKLSKCEKSSFHEKVIDPLRYYITRYLGPDVAEINNMLDTKTSKRCLDNTMREDSDQFEIFASNIDT